MATATARGLFSAKQASKGLMNTLRTNEHTSAPRLLYDRREAARQLSISVRSLDYLIGRKELSTRRLGKKVLIPHAELVRFASANHYEPITPEERTDAA
jgi:excisionase family DNA binding protein